jgi:hypothetical protein
MSGQRFGILCRRVQEAFGITGITAKVALVLPCPFQIGVQAIDAAVNRQNSRRAVVKRLCQRLGFGPGLCRFFPVSAMP